MLHCHYVQLCVYVFCMFSCVLFRAERNYVEHRPVAKENGNGSELPMVITVSICGMAQNIVLFQSIIQVPICHNLAPAIPNCSSLKDLWEPNLSLSLSILTAILQVNLG